MGVIHNAISRGIWNDALKRALGLTKASVNVERLGETLTPIINLWDRPEWSLLRGEELWSGVANQAAGAAGLFSKVGVRNPTTNFIVVVLTHTIFVGVDTDVNLFPIDTALASSGTVVMLDRRRTPSHGAVVQFEATAAAGADLMFRASVVGGVDRNLEIPIILPPGRGFMWRSSDDAAALVGSFTGYQRAALPSELL